MIRVVAVLASTLVVGVGCDKKKSPPEEPTAADGQTEPEASGAIVEAEPPIEDGSVDDGSVEPVKPGDDLQYEGSVAVVGTDIACKSDADCVPATCCHPSSCVAPKDAPKCDDTMCTLECASGTMDCFGGCLCGEDKKCASKIWTSSGG